MLACVVPFHRRVATLFESLWPVTKNILNIEIEKPFDAVPGHILQVD